MAAVIARAQREGKAGDPRRAGHEHDADSLADDCPSNGVKPDEDDNEEGKPKTNGLHTHSPTPSDDTPIRKFKSRTASHSPIKKEPPSGTQTPNSGMEEAMGGVELEIEPGKPPKLKRNATQKFRARAPPLFLDEEDKYDESATTYVILPECEYANKYIGSTAGDLDIDEIECECEEDWGESHFFGLFSSGFILTTFVSRHVNSIKSRLRGGL
jgi:hypothetical protein